MATNIQFGEYSPPPPPKGEINIRIGVFFDGTQNNRTNTNSRLGKEGEKGNKAYNKMSDKKTDSYENDYSNVARKEYCYTKGKYVDSVYVEGIGTDDFGEDSDNITNHSGVAFGTGKQGVIAKVRKGCELVADKVFRLKGDDKINSIVLDVFGFSRGAAAARNFIYELSKNKYKAKRQKGGMFEWNEDSHGYKTSLEELPKNGHLGLYLKLKNIEYNTIQIRFVGLYDTVSSYDPNAVTSPNYDNDVEELRLNDINLEVNNLCRAQKIIHFCADDEHRKNFMLTPTRVAGGKDFYLPGVHSDVGGCYTDMMDETDVQIMDFDNRASDGLSDDDYDEILNKDLDNLIEQGWFTKEEVVRPNSWHETYINRKKIRNTYSFVTLHLMSEILNEEYQGSIDENFLNKRFGIPKATKDNELDLQMVKKRLKEYVKGTKPKMQFYTRKEIEKMRMQLKGKKTEVSVFNTIVNDHNMLMKLRNKYIHWNSSFGDVAKAYRPNYWLAGKTIVRQRKKEPNS